MSESGERKAAETAGRPGRVVEQSAGGGLTARAVGGRPGLAVAAIAGVLLMAGIAAAVVLDGAARAGDQRLADDLAGLRTELGERPAGAVVPLRALVQGTADRVEALGFAAAAGADTPAPGAALATLADAVARLEGRTRELEGSIDRLTGTVAAEVGQLFVLNPVREAVAENLGGNFASAGLTVGPYAVAAVVVISAGGRSSFGTGDGEGAQNAGIALDITIDGVMVAIDDSFEGESSTMTFYSSASYVTVLAAGAIATIGANVKPFGGGSEAAGSGTHVNLGVVAIAAPNVASAP